MIRKIAVLGLFVALAFVSTRANAQALCDNCSWSVGPSVAGGTGQCMGCTYDGDYGSCISRPQGQGIGSECGYWTCPEHPSECRECEFFGDICYESPLTSLRLSPAGTAVARSVRLGKADAFVSSCGGYVVDYRGSRLTQLTEDRGSGRRLLAERSGASVPVLRI